jgi:hypothetical protein
MNADAPDDGWVASVWDGRGLRQAACHGK